MSKRKVLIIGGGLGGLFTGAILAVEGMEVTIVEKNATIGGGLQSFRRFGEVFDTGMHIIGGMQTGGNIRKLCQYLGILDKVKIKDVDKDAAGHLYFAEDKQQYFISEGREGFIRSLIHYFPDDQQEIENYVDLIFRMVDTIDIFNMRPQPEGLIFHPADFVISADEFIAQHISNPRLRSVLSYLNPLYGGRGGNTPAYIHAIINVLYIKGGSRFVDGSYHFAELLGDVIRQRGGCIITNDGVERVVVENRFVTEIITQQGRHLTADTYISAIHPCVLLSITDDGAFPKAYTDRLNSIPNTYSAFSLYIKLKPNSFKYLNRTVFYMSNYKDVWNFGKSNKDFPLGFLFMTPPNSKESHYASTALVTCPMEFDLVRRWENTTTGHRSADYKLWKEQIADILIERISEIFPNFRECVEAINTASPLTIRDFYGSKEGCLCGYAKIANNLAQSQLPVVTKVKNLLLTGQNNNLHGFCGVPLTAINTSEVILGRNYIINKINQCADQ